MDCVHSVTWKPEMEKFRGGVGEDFERMGKASEQGRGKIGGLEQNEMIGR